VGGQLTLAEVCFLEAGEEFPPASTADRGGADPADELEHSEVGAVLSRQRGWWSGGEMTTAASRGAALGGGTTWWLGVLADDPGSGGPRQNTARTLESGPFTGNG